MKIHEAPSSVKHPQDCHGIAIFADGVVIRDQCWLSLGLHSYREGALSQGGLYTTGAGSPPKKDMVEALEHHPHTQWDCHK